MVKKTATNVPLSEENVANPTVANDSEQSVNIETSVAPKPARKRKSAPVIEAIPVTVASSAKPARKRITKAAEKVEVIVKDAEKSFTDDLDDEPEQSRKYSNFFVHAGENNSDDDNDNNDAPVDEPKTSTKANVEDAFNDGFDDIDEKRLVRRGKGKGRKMDLYIDDKAASITALNKGNVWSFEPEEIYRMLLDGRKTEHWDENEIHYLNVIRPVFDVIYLDRNNDEKVEQLESQRFKVFPYPTIDNPKMKGRESNIYDGIAIRKHQIKKISDLSLENIFHVTPQEVLHLIDENMGTGWNGLPLPLQDIIQIAFYIDTSSLPASAMHRPGGIIDRRKEDGYDVLEIQRGTWIEAIFIKVKPKQEKMHFESLGDSDDRRRREEELAIKEEEEGVEAEDEADDVDEDVDRDIDEDDQMDEENPQIEDIEVIDDVEDDDEE